MEIIISELIEYEWITKMIVAIFVMKYFMLDSFGILDGNRISNQRDPDDVNHVQLHVRVCSISRCLMKHENQTVQY